MILESWLKNKWLVEHQTSRQEITNLLAVADRELTDCQVTGLSCDARLSHAYNAALQAATAALAAAGYRPARGGAHHHYVIQSLEHTLGLDSAVIAQFDAFRKKRNIGGYELAGSVSDQEAQEMFDLAKMLREKVEDLTHG